MMGCFWFVRGSGGGWPRWEWPVAGTHAQWVVFGDDAGRKEAGDSCPAGENWVGCWFFFFGLFVRYLARGQWGGSVASFGVV